MEGESAGDPRAAYLVAGPPGTEVRVTDAELADQPAQGGVVGGAAGLHAQDRDAFAGGARPVRVKGAEGVVEEGRPDQVALRRGKSAEVGQQGGDPSIPGEHVHVTMQHHRGYVAHGVQQPPQPRGHLRPAGLPRGSGGRDIGDGEQIVPFVRRELQGIGEGVQTFRLFPDTEEEARRGGPHVLEGWQYYCTSRAGHPRSAKSLTWTSIDHIATFDAFRSLSLLAPRPLLMIVGREAVTSWMSVEALQKAPGPKELRWVDGATHVDLYDKDEYVTPAVAKLTDFFGTHLAESR